MKLFRPTSVQAAVAALAESPDARCLAGGQTLVAMMNSDLVQPEVLVSLRRIDALRGIAVARDGAIAIGAMTTHDEIARFGGFSGDLGIVGAAARRIAHAPIRRVGTIGGSIAHADPAGDFPCVLVAVDATIAVTGPAGDRRVNARDFFVDYLQTMLEPGELVTAIHLPAPRHDACYCYDKLVRVDGDFAIISTAVVLAFATDGKCAEARLVVGACGPTPVRSAAADERLIGSALTAVDVDDAVALLAACCNPIDDIRATAAYRSKVLPRFVSRAVDEARARTNEHRH